VSSPVRSYPRHTTPSIEHVLDTRTGSPEKRHVLHVSQDLAPTRLGASWRTGVGLRPLLPWSITQATACLALGTAAETFDVDADSEATVGIPLAEYHAVRQVALDGLVDKLAQLLPPRPGT